MQRIPPGAGSLGGFYLLQASLRHVTGRYNSILLTYSGQTVPRFDKAGRGGFMRRFLTLVCLLCLAIPAGISISGCTRNPAGNYCNGLGYGLKDHRRGLHHAAAADHRHLAGLWPDHQVQSAPAPTPALGSSASVGGSQYTYGTTNNKLVDISPTGNICAGTWNRNTGGGIADYTYCNFPNPLPSTGGLPYGIAYITASADSVTSNPVEVFIHAQVSSVALVGPAAMPLANASRHSRRAGLLQRQWPAGTHVQARRRHQLRPVCLPAARRRYLRPQLFGGHRLPQLFRGQRDRGDHQHRHQS